MPSVKANGVDQAYDVAGSGPPLILLHAATSSGERDFGAQLPALRRDFRCHLPDARGHGRTVWDVRQGFTTGLLVDDVLAFADALALETFHVLGFSLGAMTALTLATRAPERVRSLVVIGITSERQPRTSVARRMLDPARIEREDPGWAAELAATHDPWQGEGAWRHIARAVAADVASQPLLTPSELRGIAAPALVVAGDRDPFCPVDHAWGLSRQLRDARLLIVPGSGHEVPARRPAIFLSALTAFYRSGGVS